MKAYPQEIKSPVFQLCSESGKEPSSFIFVDVMIVEDVATASVLLPLLIGLIAFLYSGVGHGGASGYIAVMILLGMTPSSVRPQALVLNCMVSALSFFEFRRVAEPNKRVFIPLCMASIPAAFLGGMISVPDSLFHHLLGFLLLFPFFRLLELPGVKGPGPAEREPAIVVLVLVGLCIGLLSGMIGIGGGILLSPLFLMMGWSGPKQVAALSALFIFVNSLSGLAAQGLVNGSALLTSLSIPVLIFALAGGIIGARFGSVKLNSVQLKRLLATVILISSVKLILT